MNPDDYEPRIKDPHGLLPFTCELEPPEEGIERLPSQFHGSDR